MLIIGSFPFSQRFHAFSVGAIKIWEGLAKGWLYHAC